MHKVHRNAVDSKRRQRDAPLVIIQSLTNYPVKVIPSTVSSEEERAERGTADQWLKPRSITHHSQSFGARKYPLPSALLLRVENIDGGQLLLIRPFIQPT